MICMEIVEFCIVNTENCVVVVAKNHCAFALHDIEPVSSRHPQARSAVLPEMF